MLVNLITTKDYSRIIIYTKCILKFKFWNYIFGIASWAPLIVFRVLWFINAFTFFNNNATLDCDKASEAQRYCTISSLRILTAYYTF